MSEAAPKTVDTRDDPLGAFREAVRSDLMELAVLHGCELNPGRARQLREADFPRGLGLALHSVRGREALDLLARGVSDASLADQHGLDELAADFAAIYLTHALRASPCESVWTDPDGMTLQEATFQVRDWYRRYALQASDWRNQADDHLVCQLQFLAHLFDPAAGDLGSLRDAARFLDEHLLRWIDGFATRVAGRCATSFYAGLSLLTAAYLTELRELLAELLDQPRPAPEEIEARMRSRRPAVAESAPAVSVPAGPSW